MWKRTAASVMALTVACGWTPALRAEDPDLNSTEYQPAAVLPADPTDPGTLSASEQEVLNQQNLMAALDDQVAEADGKDYGSSEADPQHHVYLPSSIYAEDPDLAAQGVLAGDVVMGTEEMEEKQKAIQRDIQTFRDMIKSNNESRAAKDEQIAKRFKWIGSVQALTKPILDPIHVKIFDLQREIANIQVAQQAIDKDNEIAGLGIQHLELQAEALGKSRKEQVAIHTLVRAVEKSIVLTRIAKSRLELEVMKNNIEFHNALAGFWLAALHPNNKYEPEVRADLELRLADAKAAIADLRIGMAAREKEINEAEAMAKKL